MAHIKEDIDETMFHMYHGGLLNQDGGQNNTRKETPGPRPHLLSQDSTCKPQDNYFRFKAIVLSISYRNHENMLQVVPISTEI